MKRVILIVTLGALAGCGAETATTAATGAVVKKQEIEQAKKTQDAVRQKLDQAADQVERGRKAEEASER